MCKSTELVLVSSSGTWMHSAWHIADAFAVRLCCAKTARSTGKTCCAKREAGSLVGLQTVVPGLDGNAGL